MVVRISKAEEEVVQRQSSVEGDAEDNSRGCFRVRREIKNFCERDEVVGVE